MSTESSTPETDAPPEAARWPDRVLSLLDAYGAQGRGVRATVRPELWTLFNLLMLRYLRIRVRQYPGCSEEDIEDLASEKSLELMTKLDSGTWNPQGWNRNQLGGFFSTLARNGLVDRYRSFHSRRIVPMSSPLPEAGESSQDPARESPESRADAMRFAETLRDCASILAPRARKVWFLRVFFDLATKQIATSPGVDMKPATIDVTLQRCRDRVRECMEEKGQLSSELPAGTFIALWEAFSIDTESSNGKEA